MKRLVMAYLLINLAMPLAAGAEKWSGIDESVVNKIAAEHGRSAKPLIEAEGDLQLFLFLIAGAIGGFAAGYYWRVLMEGKKKGRK